MKRFYYCRLGAFALLAAIGLPVPAQVQWKVSPQTRPWGWLPHMKIDFDSRRNRYLAVGVPRQSTAFETWQLVGTTWSQLKTKTVPTALSSSSLAFDLKRNRLVMIGFLSRTWPAVVRTWEFDGNDWSKAVAVAPIFGTNGLQYNPARSAVTTVSAGATSLDVWEYVNRAWVKRSLSNAPSTRTGLTWAVRPDTGAILVFGGYRTLSSSQQVLMDDTWILEGSKWRRHLGAAPAARHSAAMCFDEHRQRFVMSGGRELAARTKSDTWEFDGSTWMRRPADHRIPRHSHRMIWNPLKRRCVAINGISTSGGGHRILHLLLSTIDDYGPNTPADFTIYGNACDSNVNKPRLSGTPRAWLGEDLEMSVAGTSESAPILLMSGVSSTRWGSIALPLHLRHLAMPGCSLFVSPDLILSAGRKIRYRIPTDSKLAGIRYFHQALVLDASANARGLLVSDAAAITIGAK